MKRSGIREIHDLLGDHGACFETVKQIIQAHPECIHSYRKDFSVLDRAILKGRLDIVELLVQSGVQVNAQDKLGMTSLHVALQEGDRDIASYLIASGSDLHHKDKDGWEAIHFAIRSQDQKMVQFIIEQSVDWAVKTKSNEDLLTFTRRRGGEISSWFETVLKAREEALILKEVLDRERPLSGSPDRKASNSKLRI